MGCVPSDGGCDGDEKPRHRVRLTRGFWLGRTEVTVGAMRRYASSTGRGMPEAPGFSQDDRHPVVNVSWDEASGFCSWSGGRLPTEAEWEYAARGGTESWRYPWGDTLTHERVNYGKDECCGGLASGRDRWKFTSPVGSFDANGFNLYDMSGNVWEWVSDWYGEAYYGSSPAIDPRGPSFGSHRVLRGGSWNHNPRNLRVSNRAGGTPGYRGLDDGFRCARDVIP